VALSSRNSRARDPEEEQEERIRPAVKLIREAVIATETAAYFGRLRAAVILERRRELLLETMLRSRASEFLTYNRALTLLERARDHIAGDLFERLPEPICIDSDSDPESKIPGESAPDGVRRIRRAWGVSGSPGRSSEGESPPVDMSALRATREQEPR
jgi:hypothetical protein